MPDRVLLTGISGFLGGHVALQLLERGYRVRGSVRNLERAAKVRAMLARHGADISRLEFVALDLLADAGWDAAMDGVRFLQHTASPFVAEMPRDRGELVRPAVEGTKRALEAALSAGVERVVLTSSMAAIMYGHDPARTRPFIAADWTDLAGRDVNAYVESKARAERLAWEIMDGAGRHGDLVAINPGGILGPLLEDDPGTSAALIQRLMQGEVPAAPRISFIIVDVRDVAALHVAAMEKPEAGGHRYPTGSGTWDILEIADMLRAGLGADAGRLPRFRIPDWLVRAAALFDPVLRSNLGELGVVKHADTAAAEALLGHPFIPAADAVTATARSLIEYRLVPKKGL